MPDPFVGSGAPAGGGDRNADLLDALARCASQWGDAQSWDVYQLHINHVEQAAAEFASPVFHDVCVLFKSFVNELSECFERPEEAHRDLLQCWPTLAAAFCEFPHDVETGRLLIAHLQDPRWIKPIGDDDARLMQSFLDPPASAAAFPAVAGEESAADPGNPDGVPQFAATEESCELHGGDGGVGVAMSGTENEGALDNAAREMVELLIGELDALRQSLAETLTVACSSASSSEARIEALTHYGEQIARLGMAAKVGGLKGLGRACQLLSDNIDAYCRRDTTLDETSRQLMSAWIARIVTYLHDLGGEPACRDLMETLRDPSWPAPLGEDDAAELGTILSAPVTEALMQDVEPRQTSAKTEDVSLSLPDDVDPELLDGLLQELPAQTAEFAGAVQRLTSGEGGLGELQVAQRVAHTLKGAANTVGVPGIANLTHHLEDILLSLAKHGVLPGPALGGVLQNASDCLEMMCEALLGQGSAPADSLSVLQSVLDWANRIDKEGADAAAAGALALARLSIPSPPLEKTPPPGETERVETKPPPAKRAAKDAGPMVRVSAKVVDELLRLMGEIIILTSQLHERVQRGVAQSRALQRQNVMLQQLGAELEQIIDLRDIALPRQRGAGPVEFDPLEMDQYNELHTVSRRLVEAATDSREMGRELEADLSTLNEMLTQQGRLNRETREAVMHARMVAVKTIIPRLQRSVRQASRAATKQVVLECLGADTMMDSNVINDLVDPLMHLLRNAVDHGIEDETERIGAGKDPQGRIRLEFQREGNHVLVRCSDDGAGLDWVKIREVAASCKLVSEGQTLTEAELCQLVLRPNFSTRPAATQLSGRGIGLDAVRSSITRLGGSFSLHSETGKGLRFEMRLPLTLVSTHALLVRTRGRLLALSNRGVEQILHPGSGEESREGDSHTFSVGDEIYPATTLASIIGLGKERKENGSEVVPVLIVQSENGTRAVFVDSILESRDLVIKDLGRYIPKLRGIAGATILGDGSVTPVLDLPELLRTPGPAGFDIAPLEERNETAQAVGSGLPYALVVDDSLSARRMLAQFIGDSGFEVGMARDGLEAIDLINAKRPDLVLLDLEMPRMNGLELTSHIRANSTTRQLPIVMITSRSTEKHRQQAMAAGVDHYVTKPFSEEELLGCVESLCRGNK
jgi:chemotaxis protein histidine kinase CheA